ncbi:hypothetical protein HNQ84_000417 [Anoxybacillus eryuanensis]
MLPPKEGVERFEPMALGARQFYISEISNLFIFLKKKAVRLLNDS